MSARMKFNGKLASPGQLITVKSELKTGQAMWAGATDSKEGEQWKEVDIPASSYFEHNRGESRVQRKRVLIEGDVPAGMVISGIGNPQTGEVLIVTREASDEEKEIYGRDRLPALIPARF